MIKLKDAKCPNCGANIPAMHTIVIIIAYFFLLYNTCYEILITFTVFT